MLMRAQAEIPLHCHPDTPCPAVATIKTAINWEKGGFLKIVYTLSGAVDRLVIPPRRRVRWVNGLWQHTCFELFVGAQNDAEYYELNFSPSGEWAIYGFRGYRDGGPIDVDEIEPKIAVQQGIDALELSAMVHPECLPGITPGIRLSVGLSAVIEDLHGSLSYWALKHPPGKPDFHHAENFAVELVVPG